MIVHLLYFLGLAWSLPWLPIVWIQARRVKKTVPRLPEARRNLTGRVGTGEQLINLVALGESTIAGVGVEDHADGVVGHTAKTIEQLTQKRVEWKVIAKSGYTAQKVSERLVEQLPEGDISIIVIGLGANDTFAFNPPATWQKHVRQLIAAIRTKHNECPIVFANMPPVGQFPAFPRIMQVVLGGLITLHGLALQSLVKQQANVYYVDRRIKFKDWADRAGGNVSVHDLFCDGVHPSPVAYALWGREIGEYVVERGLL